MKTEYYYLEGKDQKGPFTIEDLKANPIKSNTLVWRDGMENWKEAKDVADLHPLFQPGPPIPPSAISDFNKSEGVTNSNVRRLIIWISIHLFILLMSNSEISFFTEGSYRKDQFWPFVSFISQRPDWKSLEENRKAKEASPKNDTGYGSLETTGLIDYSRGIFIDYDITEFLFYAGSGFVIFILISIPSKKKL